MKCPHCGQEHPDNFKFCPNTGKTIDSQLKACVNPDCSEFGKSILPMEAMFCPACGASLKKEVDNFLEFKVGDCEFKMILVKHGNLLVGGECGERKIKQTEDFYIAEVPVTQKLWFATMRPDEPYNIKYANHPITMLTWGDFNYFLHKLNGRLANVLSGRKFRFPTETEWEFAAYGGNRSRHFRFSGSDELAEVGWYNVNSNSERHEVGLLKPNELGLYDMCGNVYEWCEDYYNYSSSSHVVKGGTYKLGSSKCEIASRDCCMTGHWAIGFRLCLS